MKKEEQNQILEDLWNQVDLGEFKSEIIEMSKSITKTEQLHIMWELLARLPYENPEYDRLNAAVNVAIADSEKGK